MITVKKKNYSVRFKDSELAVKLKEVLHEQSTRVFMFFLPLHLRFLKIKSTQPDENNYAVT